jgi:DNA-binding HxlR family transcriptional regulator
LISRTQYNEIPPRVEYSLTDDGDEVRTRLEPLLEWASAAE